MENENVVKEELTPPQPSEGKTPAVIPGEITPPAPGSKTASELLLVSLKEEREKRRVLEEEKKSLEEQLENSSALSDEVFSDEGKTLKKQITTLTEKINSIEEGNNLQLIYSLYPVLKEKSEEFKTFREDYPRTKLENVAKLYLSENGLLEPSRKGLEKPTGGLRIPTTSGMTAENVKILRETNFKKYQDMLSKGLIKIES